MKASFYTESILYSFAKGLSGAAQRLPADWCAVFGSSVGVLAYHLLPRRRVVGLENLRAAFGDSYTPAEYQQILKMQFQHLGMMLMEVARIPRIDLCYLNRWVTIAPKCEERLKAALAQGHGVIFLTGHFGNWELISITGALNGYPILVLARQQGWPKLNALLTRYRELKGCKVITKGFPIREIIRGLEQGRIVGMLSDQDGGRHGVLAPFFGRLASTAPGAIALGIDTQAPVLPVFVVRRRGAAHTLIVEEPLAIPATGSIEERIQQGIVGYLNVLERYVRRYPHLWLWLHRRWKSSPQKKILVFSDGKPGHDTQSKALAERISEAWKVRTRDDKRLHGFQGPLVRVVTVPVAFRHPLLRALLSWVAGAVPRRFSGGDFWLRLCLKPNSYQAICSAHADWSISCGAAAAPVNLLWAWSIGCKAIQINRSRWPSWRRFHGAVIPEHDRPPSPAPANLFVTNGALSLARKVDPEQMADWRRRLGIHKSRQIGLLLGGPARGVTLEAAQVQQALRSLLAASEKLDAELLVTSSRRTPAEVERWLHEILANHPRCRLLVLVNRREAGGLEATQQAVPCILGLAQTLVVSGDSISMISEALARSKPVVSFLPKQVGFKEPKYHRFLQELSRQGEVTLAEPEKVGEAVIKMMNNGAQKISDSGGPRSAGGADPLLEFLVKWL